MAETLNLVKTAYVVLGSNIEPEKNLVRAVQLLTNSGIITARSSVYQSKPQGDPQQADFLNLAVRVKTSYEIAEFKSIVLDSIEQQLGRVRDPQNKNAPRTIDLDIVLWGKEVLDYGEKPWHVPEADILKFAHIAIPLAEVEPEYIHPETGQTLGQIATQFDKSTLVVRNDINFGF